MKLRQLEILRALIRCQTTTAAAEELGMSQPAVSNAIRQIEAQLGFPLFERVNNRLFPLEAAMIIHDETEPMFAMQAALQERLQDLREDKVSRLRILSTPPLGHGVVPAVMLPFTQRHPKLKIYFDVRELNDVILAVESGRADLGFGLNLGAQPTLEMESLFEGNMVCALNAADPRAGMAKLTLADFQGQRFIALDAHTRMGAQVRDAFQEARQPLNFTVEVRYCNTACILVEAGMGAAVVDPFSASFSGRRHLAVRPLEPSIPCVAWAFWSNRRPLSEIARRFVREIRLALTGSNAWVASPAP